MSSSHSKIAAGQFVELLSTLRKLNLQQKEVPFSTGGPGNQTRPTSDPQHQIAAASQSLNNAGRVVIGRITDATPIGQVYRVQLEKVKWPMAAVYMPRTSTTRFGTTEFTSLQPGTEVVCYLHDTSRYAIILGTIPVPNMNPSRGLFGILHTSTRGRVDEADYAPYTMEGNGGAISFSSGRPYDAILGDYGAMSETGCRVLIDSFMAQIGVTEMSQLTCYHHDMLVKLAAYNFIEWTACAERESLNDQDEVSDFTGYATYPWEQLGFFSRTDPTRMRTAQEWQKTAPAYSSMEPVDDYLMPFHRERVWHGYLGQGGRKTVTGPPQFAAGLASHLSYAGGSGIASPVLPGLYDEFTLLDGRHGMQSAKGISIVKRAAIMLPVRRRRPEDKAGDNETNYAASGSIGGGTAHSITGDIAVDSAYPAQSRALGIMDMHAYFFNYANNQPFIAHTQDYSVAEEAAATWVAGAGEDTPTFGALRQQMFIDANNYKRTVHIDNRYGDQDIYTLPCGIELLDDGGVVLFGGCGEEIRMAGGSITLSAPGDIWVKSGRNANIWGGDDVNIRAKNSADIIATNKDVRIKSENNMQLIAGNSGTGGLLMESRSRGNQFDFSTPGEQTISSGIVMRAPESVVAAWSQDIYLRTGSEDGSIAKGIIYLDAAKGEQQIITVSSSITNHVKNVVEYSFGEPGDPSVVALFSRSLTTLTGTLFVNGDCAVDGGLFAKNSLFSASGHIYTANASDNHNLVGSLIGESLESVLNYVEQVPERVENTQPEAVRTRFESTVTDRIYVSGGVGNDDVITQAQGSLRSADDYGTQNFVMFEDRWQQLARLNKEPLLHWSERPVEVQNSDTYPYPGKPAFADGAELFYQQDTVMFDAEHGRSHPHGTGDAISDLYATPRFATPKGVTLDEYTVIGGS